MDKAIRSQLITGSDNPDHSQKLVVEVDKYTNTAEKLAKDNKVLAHPKVGVKISPMWGAM